MHPLGSDKYGNVPFTQYPKETKADEELYRTFGY